MPTVMYCVGSPRTGFHASFVVLCCCCLRCGAELDKFCRDGASSHADRVNIQYFCDSEHALDWLGHRHSSVEANRLLRMLPAERAKALGGRTIEEVLCVEGYTLHVPFVSGIH